MPKINTRRYLLLFVCLFSLISEVHANGHYQIVAHPKVHEDVLSANVLRSIFSMRMRTWSNGSLIKVFVLSDNDELHQDFSKEKLNLFPYQLRLAWDRLVFSGTGQAPVYVDSHDDMLAKVASTPGAIGYLKTTYISDDIHVLQIK